jgi:cellobiose phosphorylase
VYLRDLETATVWTINGRPGEAPPTRFECRHGLGYSEIRSLTHRIEGRFRIHVLPDDPVEVWTIRVANLDSRVRRLALFPFAEWYLGDNLQIWDDPVWYTATRFVASEPSIVASFHDPTALGQQYTAFMSPCFPVRTYACSRATFQGARQESAVPGALRRGMLGCHPACGEATIGVVEHRFTLRPGRERVFHVLLGVSESTARRRRLIRRYRCEANRRRAWRRIEAGWDRVVETNTVETPDAAFNRWVNVWLKYQQVQCYRWGPGGGQPNSPQMGFRDTLQHTMGLSLVDPSAARAWIAEALRHQYRSGRAVRAWSRRGNHDRRDYRDSPVWILFALTTYLKETADLALLEERIPYLDGGAGTVLDHAQAAVKGLYGDRGSHGLSHIGRGDWLDPLNRAGVRGRGESVWLSMALHWGLRRMAELQRLIGDSRRAALYEDQAENLRRRINRYGWDGEWYIQAFDDGGRAIGSRRRAEGRIFLLPQVWAVLSGVADPDRAALCAASADRHLRTPFGYRLWTPPYTRYDDFVGSVTILQNQELVYCHGNAFKVAADCAVGRGAEAHRLFMMLTPDNPENPPEKSWAAPHIIPNGYSALKEEGRWGRMIIYGFSGTFPWLLRTAIEGIGGARAEYDGLRIDPCLPPAWRACRVRRLFRGSVYDIRIDNPDHVSRGVRRLTVNGRPHPPDRVIPPPRLASTVRVDCVLGG